MIWPFRRSRSPAGDDDGGSTIATFDLTVNNVVAQRSPKFGNGQRRIVGTNSGTYADVPADTVSLAASVGAIVATATAHGLVLQRPR